MRPEAVLGVGLQKRIWRAGPLALELEADLFSHIAQKQQPGGEFNQRTPYADLAAQTFGEGIVGIGARLWVQPWLSFSVLEGISYNTQVSLYEKTFRENYSKLLNYLGFEVEAVVSPEVSLVGRIHHRSGAFGTYNGVTEGSNAYLLGLRYRWGQDQKPDLLASCRRRWAARQAQSEGLSDGGEHGGEPSSSAATATVCRNSRRRNDAIAGIEQRIDDVDFRGNSRSNDALAFRAPIEFQCARRKPFRRGESTAAQTIGQHTVDQRHNQPLAGSGRSGHAAGRRLACRADGVQQ